MNVHSDYEDLFKILNAYRIKYLVVGAYAVMYYAQPRYTKDIDVWIVPQLNDTQRIHDALKAFGAPLTGITPEDFADRQMILQIGIAPVRIDIMTDVSGISFKDAWKNRKKARYGRTRIYLLSREDLIAAKKKAARLQDKIDLENLSKQV